MTTAAAAAVLAPRVLATGAWLKNAACRLDAPRGVDPSGDADRRPARWQARWSPLHGDLGDPAHCAALADSLDALLALGPVQAVAHDLHPDFHSTRLALALAQRLGVPAIGVQHHHAHIAVVLAEQALQAAPGAAEPGPVIGLALDGVGLGSDGQAWGGELLWVHGARWRRLGQLWPLALPGGDVAAREPWRMAAAALHALGRGDEIAARFAPVVGEPAARGLATLLARGLRCPPTSSTGRWFDAAAGALGLSVRQQAEAEAAQALERAAAWHLGQCPPPVVARPAAEQAADLAARPPAGRAPRPDPACTPIDDQGRLDLRPLLARLLAVGAARAAVSPAAAPPPLAGDQGRALGGAATGHADPVLAEAAADFHVQLAAALVRWAVAAARRHGVAQVALGGGCFVNRLLAQRVHDGLVAAGLQVLAPRTVPCGDAGLALGQAWVAAALLRSGQPLAAHTTCSPLTEKDDPCAWPCLPK